tara:strand:- start:388 stop:543 length:156 start_codon:yes stop_codon:yes gene_type:complete
MEKNNVYLEFIKEMGLEGTFQEFISDKYVKEGHSYTIIHKVKPYKGTEYES